MTTDNDPIHDRFSDAFDGELSAEERRAFDARLAADPDAADDYASFVAATTALRDAAPGRASDDHVRGVLAAVAGAPAPGGRAWGLWSHAAAAVLGAAACLAVVLTLDDDATTGAPDAASRAGSASSGAADDATPALARLDGDALRPSPGPAPDATPTTGVPTPDVDDDAPAMPAPDDATKTVASAETSAETSVADDSVADAAPHDPGLAARPRPAPLFELHIDGRRLASTWAGLRDDVATLLAASAARTPPAPPAAPPRDVARSEPPSSAPTPESAVARVEAPAEPSAPREIAWPDELRSVARTEPPKRRPSTLAAAALASTAALAAPQRDGVRLESVDDRVSALRTRGTLVDVVPTLIATLGDDDDPATALAAEQLDQIAARLARDPAVAGRLVTPRYEAPTDPSWFTSLFGGGDDDAESTPTHDGSVASYWRSWYAANSALLAERLDAREV